MEWPKNLHMVDWVKYGGLTGAVISFYWVLIALVAPSYLFNSWTGWMPVLITLIGMLIFDKKVVSDLTFGDFKAITSLGFKFYLMAMGLYYLVDFALYQGIIDDLGQMRLDISLERISANESILGQENASAMRENLINEGTEYTFSSLLFNFARSLIGGFVMAIIVGRYIMRN